MTLSSLLITKLRSVTLLPYRGQQLVMVKETKEELPLAKPARLPVMKTLTPSGRQVEVCNTPECQLAADAIIEALDNSVNPCVNFYEFTCGSWLQANPVPDDASIWGQMEEMDRSLFNALSDILTEPVDAQDPAPINKAKHFYAGCIDEAHIEEMGVKPLTDFLAQFGGWPMTLNKWDDTDFNFPLKSAWLQSRFSYLLKLDIDIDIKDPFSYVIQIDQTSLGLPRSVLVDPDNNKNLIEAYKTYITTTANIVSKALGQDGKQVPIGVDEVLAFEIKLANITTPKEERRDVEKLYNEMTVTELSKLTGTNWLDEMQELFEPTDFKVDANTRVIVAEPTYMSDMSKLLHDSGKRIVSNYLMWRYVKDLGDYTTQAMREASLQFDMVELGVKSEMPRSTMCAEAANKYMGMAIGTKYVDTYFPQEAKDKASEMVEDLREAFKSLLEANEWMDSATKVLANEKADSMGKSIGFPDWYNDDNGLETYYAGLSEIKPTTHFDNVLALE